MSEPQGDAANRNGKAFENAIAGILSRYGLMDVTSQMEDVSFGSATVLIQELCKGWFIPIAGVFSRQTLLCVSIFEKETREDLLLYKPGWPTPLAIASKNQNGSGSCDEKLEYLFNNVNERFPCPCVILLAGKGWIPGVRSRANEWIQRSRGRVAQILWSLDDMEQWACNGLKYPSFTEPNDLGLEHR